MFRYYEDQCLYYFWRLLLCRLLTDIENRRWGMTSYFRRITSLLGNGWLRWEVVLETSVVYKSDKLMFIVDILCGLHITWTLTVWGTERPRYFAELWGVLPASSCYFIRLYSSTMCCRRIWVNFIEWALIAVIWHNKKMT